MNWTFLRCLQNPPSLYSSSGRGSGISGDVSATSHDPVSRANSSSLLLDQDLSDPDLAMLGEKCPRRGLVCVPIRWPLASMSDKTDDLLLLLPSQLDLE